MKIIIIYGLRRSGNHYLQSLIAQQFKNYVILNDLDNFNYESFKKYENIEKTVRHKNNEYTGFKNCDCLIIGQENKQINYFELSKFKHQKIYVYMILRNPYDHLSSIYKVYNKNINLFKEVFNLWLIYYNYYIDTSNIIKINYDLLTQNDDNYIDKKLKYICNNPVYDKNVHLLTDQKSSYKNNERARKISSSLYNCNASKCSEFIEYFENLTKIINIDKLWNDIKDKYI